MSKNSQRGGRDVGGQEEPSNQAGPSGYVPNQNQNANQNQDQNQYPNYNYGYNQQYIPQYAPHQYVVPPPAPVAAARQEPIRDAEEDRENYFRDAINGLAIQAVPGPPEILVGDELIEFENNMRNPFDTRRMRAITFPAMTVASDLISRNINISYLAPSIDDTDQVDVTSACKALEITSLGRCLRKNWNVSQHLPIMCCELVAPFLPDDKFQTRANSRIILCMDMYFYFKKYGCVIGV